MFVVVYDLSDMPPNSQTFLRQRTLYMPVKGSPSDAPNFMVYLRYLIHLRLVLFFCDFCCCVGFCHQYPENLSFDDNSKSRQLLNTLWSTVQCSNLAVSKILL